MTPGATVAKSGYRRIANLCWLAVTLALAVETVGFVVSRSLAVSRYNANINRLKSAAWEHAPGGAGGVVSVCRSGQRAEFAVFNEFVGGDSLPPEETGRFQGCRMERPYSTGRWWYALSRTKEVRLDDPPGRVLFVRGSQVEAESLPSGLTPEDLLAFARSPASSGGIAAYRQWRDQRAK